MKSHYETTQNKINIDGSNLTPGIYFVELRIKIKLLEELKS